MMTLTQKVGIWLVSYTFLLAGASGIYGQNALNSGATQKLPSVDEVLGKSLQATGGHDAWLKLTSMHIKATVTVNPAQLSGTMDLYSKAPDKESDCIRFQAGVFFCRGYNGVDGWQDDSRDGLKPLIGKQLEDMRRDADFYAEIDRKKYYSTLKVVREDKFDSLRVYVLEGLRNDGQKQELYFAKDSGFHVGGKDLDARAGESKTYFFEDYQRIAGPAILIPTKMRFVTGASTMRVVVSEILPNTEIADSIFAKPEKSARDPQGAGLESHPDNGKVTEGVYRNEFFGFTYKLPLDWTIHGEETEKVLMESGKQLIAGDDDTKKKLLDLASQRTFHLLTAFEFPLGTPGKPNRSIQLIAENVSFAPGIRTGKDYILNLRQTMAQGQLKIEYPGEPTEETIGGVGFYRQDMTIEISTVTVYEIVYCTILKEYAITYILVARSKQGVEEVANSIASFRRLSAAAKP
jgi:hypothetical protein